MSDETPTNPVLDNLNQAMRCAILTNTQGEILIVHDEPLESEVQWIEYAPDEERFSIVHEGGHIQELGITLNQKIKENLKHGQEVTLAHMVKEDVISSQKVSFIIQEH